MVIHHIHDFYKMLIYYLWHEQKFYFNRWYVSPVVCGFHETIEYKDKMFQWMQLHFFFFSRFIKNVLMTCDAIGSVSWKHEHSTHHYNPSKANVSSNALFPRLSYLIINLINAYIHYLMNAMHTYTLTIRNTNYRMYTISCLLKQKKQRNGIVDYIVSL